MASPVLTHVDPDTSPIEIAEILKRDGALIIDNLADRNVLTRFESEIAPWITRTALGADEFTGVATQRTGALIARSPAARELVMDPTVLATAKALLPENTTMQLHLTQTIAIGPGETAQAIHRDQWAWNFFPFPSGFDVQCNTIWALTDFTEENGATRVIPGSNLREDRLRLGQEETVPAEMKRGSVLVYSGSVYHGGGANQTTDQTRIGINITYCLGWLRQEENQYLSCPPEVARTLPKDLLRLMGYQSGAYALGYVDDARDPLDALFGPSSVDVGRSSSSEDLGGPGGSAGPAALQSFGPRPNISPSVEPTR